MCTENLIRLPQRNLAVELLQKLLKGELKTRSRKNVVQARSFAEMLEQTIRRYQNRAIEAAQVIEELIALVKEMREANARGDVSGLTEDELAFYDALESLASDFIDFRAANYNAQEIEVIREALREHIDRRLKERGMKRRFDLERRKRTRGG